MTFPTFIDWGTYLPVDEHDAYTSPPEEVDLATSVTLALGDLLIVTLSMWMASGGTPTLALGHWPGGSPFIDETSDWTPFGAVSNGHAYMRSYWRRADSGVVAAGTLPVIGQLSGFDWTVDGGVVWLTVFRGTGPPVLVYQDTATTSTVDTPLQAAGDPIIHTYFGRSAYAGAAATPIIQPFGLYGQSGSYPSLQTADVDDNGVSGPGSPTFTDTYGAGYFYPRGGSLPTTYDGQITWDNATGHDSRPGLGPQTSVIQGIRVPAPASNFMMVL